MGSAGPRRRGWAATYGEARGLTETRFATAAPAVPVLRGHATRPLYVTAAGMPAADAAELIRRMSGPYRLPDALRLVDALSRDRAV